MGKKLRRRADSEVRLQTLVTYWFSIASSFLQEWRVEGAVVRHIAAEQERVRQYKLFRFKQGDSPKSIALPDAFHRIDEWLPDIASRLSVIHSELLGLPGAVRVELGARFSDYSDALGYLAALPTMLKTVADAWDRPRRGQPGLKLQSHALGLLICAVEDYTGERLPPPRSVNRQPGIDLIRLLAAQLFPSHTPKQIGTMLNHFHKERLDEAKRLKASSPKEAAVEYSIQNPPQYSAPKFRAKKKKRDDDVVHQSTGGLLRYEKS